MCSWHPNPASDCCFRAETARAPSGLEGASPHPHPRFADAQDIEKQEASLVLGSDFYVPVKRATEVPRKFQEHALAAQGTGLVPHVMQREGGLAAGPSDLHLSKRSAASCMPQSTVHCSH